MYTMCSALCYMCSALSHTHMCTSGMYIYIHMITHTCPMETLLHFCMWPCLTFFFSWGRISTSLLEGKHAWSSITVLTGWWVIFVWVVQTRKDVNYMWAAWCFLKPSTYLAGSIYFDVTSVGAVYQWGSRLCRCLCGGLISLSNYSVMWAVSTLLLLSIQQSSGSDRLENWNCVDIIVNKWLL